MDNPSDSENNALTFTESRLSDQLGHLVPQIHLTLVSVLQSIALAFLLASFHGPSSNTLVSLWMALLDHHFYLPHLVSLFIVIIVWNEFAYATFFLHWPLTAFSTMLQFLLAVIEVIAFTNVDTVGAWTVGVGLVSLLGAYIHRRDLKITSDELYPYGSVTQNIVTRGEWLFWALGIMVVFGAFRLYPVVPFADLLSHVLSLGTVRVVPFDFIAPLIFLGASLFIMREDDGFYVDTVNSIFTKSGSPYYLEKNGRIRRRKKKVEEHGLR